MNPFDLPSVETPEDEEARERDYWSFETECLAFAARYGWPATIKALGRAMQEQRELIPK